jgi:hypothetical protein
MHHSRIAMCNRRSPLRHAWSPIHRSLVLDKARAPLASRLVEQANAGR